ncbi:tetratricopeptide repeat protein [Botrimarina colliarenosi]|uniref:Tetratricopeptide repeat protein n=1 Tax=Botrimarina colliarenosi TaxID=2528001 RepID=A0A5C6AEV7_9BACT|nr:exosortase [Botrimarina colliarenosi]TWT97591.1 tetratricopeptide repeat protein [Botrimarina colliarenosi]
MAPATFKATLARRAALFAALIGLGCWAYWPTLHGVVDAWSSNADYSHGFLIIPLVVLLLWTTRADGPPAENWRTSPAALWLFAVAAGLRLFAGRVYLPELDAWSFPVWIAAATWIVFGWRTLVWSAPALLLLCFAAPLPASMENVMGAPLRSLGATLSSGVLRVLGEPAVAEGATILLNEHQLDVEQACSGLRMFYGIAALAVCVVAYSRPPAWQAAILLLATLPIAVLTNVLRIVSLALLHLQFTGKVAGQLGHDYAGLLVIPVAFGALLLVRWGLQSIQSYASGEGSFSLLWWAPVGVSAIVLLLALFPWASRQRNAIVSELTRTATSFAEESEWIEAIDYFKRALQLRPDDVSLLTQIGEAEQRYSQSLVGRRRAFAWYEQAYRLDGDNLSLGIKAAKAAYDAERFDKTLAIGAQLLRRTSDPTARNEVIRLRADAALESARRGDDWPALGHDDYSAILVSAELDEPPLRHVQAVIAHLEARMAPSAEDPIAAEADRLLTHLTQQRPDDPRAWLARYEYALRRAERMTDVNLRDSLREQAEADLGRALAEAGKHPEDGGVEVYLIAAEKAISASDQVEAARLYWQAIDASPNDFRSYLALANLLARSEEQLEEACEVLEQGLAARPGIEITLAMRLAMLRAKLGQFDSAEATIATLNDVLKQIPVEFRTEVRLAIDLVDNEIIGRRDGVEDALAHARAIISRAQSDPDGQASTALLGQALERFGRLAAASGWHDTAVQTLLSASKLNALSDETAEVLANSAALVGDLRLAQSIYSQLRKTSPTNPTRIGQELSIAIRERALAATPSTRWSDLESRLQEAQQAGLDLATGALLLADIVAAKEGAAPAVASLEQALNETPESGVLWRGLALLRLQAGEYDEAIEAARQYVLRYPEDREPRRFLCRLLAKAGRLDEAAEEIQRDLNGLTQEGGNDTESWLTLADIELRRDDRAAAMQALKTAAELAPRQVRPIQAMAELAAAAEDWPQVAQLERQLLALEGEAGVYWRLYGAQRYLAAANARNDEALRSAARVAQQLLTRRPDWSEAHFLQGEVERRLENTAAAAEQYLSAWDHGKRTPLVADRLLESFVKQGRFDEATSFLSELRELLAASPRLFDRAAALTIETESTDRLIQVAREFVERAPNSADAKLRLARILLIADSMDSNDGAELREEAIASLRDAVRLDPRSYSTWKAAVLLGVGGERSQENVVRWVDDLQTDAPLDDLTRRFVLAQSLEAEGHSNAAAVRYLDGVNTLRNAANAPAIATTFYTQAARFFLGVSPFLAERIAREAVVHDQDSPAAKLALAQALATSGGSAVEGLGLLDSDSVGDVPIDQEALRLTRARLLRERGKPDDIAEAITLLEAGLNPPRTSQLLLSQLLESRGDFSSALTLLESLTDRSDASPSECVAFLEFWQRHCLTTGDTAFTERADNVYNTLASSSPAEWLRWKLREQKFRREDADPAEGNPAVGLLEELITQSKEDVTLARFTELLLTTIQEQTPESVLEIVKAPPSGISVDRVATAACNAILVHDANNQLLENERLIDQIVSLNPDIADVLQASGDYYLVMGADARSQQAYEQTVRIDPARAEVYNNLAVASASTSRGNGESQKWLDRAAERGYGLTGREDTRAWLRLTAGKPLEAIEIIDSLPQAEIIGDPTIQLHRAMALDGAGRYAEALLAFERALGAGVERRTLLPRERRFVEAFKRKASTQATRQVAASQPTQTPEEKLAAGDSR